MKKYRVISLILMFTLVLCTLGGCDDGDYEDYAEYEEYDKDGEEGRFGYEDEYEESDGSEASEDYSETDYETTQSASEDGEDDLWSLLFGDFFDTDDSEATSYLANDSFNDLDTPVDADSFTLMVYICGSNLESEGGLATNNINQMLYANPGNNLNIVMETGGASQWQNSVISSDTLQRYVIDSQGLTLVEDLGSHSITDAGQLADFINDTAQNYPADRYGFIFWDHGGGTIGGYGGDENYDNSSMSITEIEKGFANANVHFDFIGFDCCLMATVEIANSLSNYSDYLLASEETEPGTGWYYTNFVEMMENDPGVSVPAIGKRIIDDFNSTEYTGSGEKTTLSLIDLSQIANVVDKMNEYMAGSENYLVNNGFGNIAKARAGARSYGDDEFEQIDIIDYAQKVKNLDATELIDAVQKAVVYNGTNIPGSNGLAMYFPYYDTGEYSTYSGLANAAGMNDELYNRFFEEFVTLQTGGQVSGGGNSNPYASDDGQIDYSFVQQEAWYDQELVDSYSEYYSYLDSDELGIEEKNGTYVLKMSDEEWDLITDIEMQVYVDDGQGYVQLGSDDFFKFDDDGDLIVDYDFYWMFINDEMVPYYVDHKAESIAGKSVSIGYVPAVLNESKDIRIWIRKIEDEFEILGYTPEGGATGSKGYFSFKDGDVIEFLFDCYDYDGNYDDAFTFENSSLVYDSSQGMEAYYDEIADYGVQVCFYLKDIYQNEYWTEPLVYE